MAARSCEGEREGSLRNRKGWRFGVLDQVREHMRLWNSKLRVEGPEMAEGLRKERERIDRYGQVLQETNTHQRREDGVKAEKEDLTGTPEGVG